ncbi:MAG: nucleoside triphosphate pyrophosphohydrolase [Actinomycetota bacterium]|nr:nucleoside triphosphate pyrophosphohydrolase [Actinomycetota bacterium]
MSLVVVPLAPEELGTLTLAELDVLLACDPVVFERSTHPLIHRLRAEGVRTELLDEAGLAHGDGSAFVCDPGSPRVVELARDGAEVLGLGGAPDALTAAWGSAVSRRAGLGAAGLAAIMARLRSPDGCPWDLEQTHESLKPHLIEEAYEVIDAIERGKTDADLEEELGDLLLQVAFHAQLAEEGDRFDLAGVAERISAKLLHRHPHVFSDVVVSGAQQVVANWETLKSEEKQRQGPFDDIPEALPALVATSKTQKRAAALGFAPTPEHARERAGDALASDELGEALFWTVALARRAGVDPEGALRAATARFKASFAP